MSLFLSYLDQKIQTLLPLAEARRLYHGRGKEFDNNHPLTIDYYPPGLLFLTSFVEQDTSHLSELIQYFKNQNWLKIDTILWQTRSKGRPNLEVLEGTLTESYFVYEDGAKYALKIGQNQNLGFFLDMRHGRRWVKEHARGLRVLNLFSYTASFSVAALRGEALEVVNLDMSKPALELAEYNHALNGIESRKAKFLAYDLLKSFGKITKFAPYDLIIIDPPFDQSSFSLVKDLNKVLRRLPSLLSDRAKILVAVNSPHHNWEEAKELISLHLSVEFSLVETLSAPSEFVETEEGRGLKIFIFDYTRSS